MSPKYYSAAENGQRDRWMISYVDVLTILLIFFVAIAAQSLHRLQPSAITSTAAPAAAAAAANAGAAANGQSAAANAAAAKTPAMPSAAPMQLPNPRPDALVPEARQTLLRAQQSLEKHGL